LHKEEELELAALRVVCQGAEGKPLGDKGLRLQRELVLTRFLGLSAAEYVQFHGLTYRGALDLLARFAQVQAADFADSADSGRTC